MKSKMNLWFTLLLAFSVLLGACSTPSAPTTAPQPTATTAPVVQPTQPPAPTAVVPQPATDVELDAAFTKFQTGMVKYNALRLEPFAEMLTADPKPFLLDVRETAEVEKSGHIAGTVLIPIRTLAQNLDKLPSFDTPIVAYCGTGWRCTIAMTYLETLGWENVLALKDNSFTGWVDAGYAFETGLPAEAAALNAASPDTSLVLSFDKALTSIPDGWGGVAADKLMTDLVEKRDLVLIDVRTAAEVTENGYIEAQNELFIPIEEFVQNRSSWPADKNAPITVYCGTGHRSTIAMSILWSYGYTNVNSLKGGLGPWAQAGLPVVGGKQAGSDLDKAFSTFLGGMVKYNTMSLDELNTAMLEDQAFFLLDVREVSEVEAGGHIEGAVNIPLRTLAKNLDKLPSFDTKIVAYCGIGWRCTIAMPALQVLGWENVVALKGNSFTGWKDAGYPVVAGLPEEAAVLNAATPDPAMAAAMDSMLSAVPENYGVIASDALAVQLTEKPELVLIDVRTSAERADAGVIEKEGTIAIPIEEFITQKAQWPADKNAAIVVYCGTGHRSTIAMSILWSYGYTNVHSLKGGLGAWVAAEFPVVPAP
jgi:rhodanese-related sulfurtransferase